MVEKAKAVTGKKEAPPEVKPEQMQFVDSKREFTPEISEWEFF